MEMSDSDVVANVNKHGAVVVEKQSKKISAKGGNKRKNEQQNVEKRESKRRKCSDRNSDSDQGLTNVSVIEDDQVVRYAVRSTSADRELLSTTDHDESDDEVTFKERSEESNLSEGEIRDDSDSSVVQREKSRDMNSKNDKKHEEDVRIVQKRDIDREVLNKIDELKKLMSEGGMSESTKLLSKVSEFAEDRIEGRKKLIRNENHNASRQVNEQSNEAIEDNVNCVTFNSKSLETIYQEAVPKRVSTSSEDDFVGISSDDSIHLKNGNDIDKQIEDLIVDERRRVVDRGQRRSEQIRQPDYMIEQPTTSDGRRRDLVPFTQTGEIPTPEEKAREMVRKAEISKAKILATPGKNHEQPLLANLLTPTALVDEGYMVVGAHVDEATILKIEKGEYVDFAKLIPKDKVLAEEETRLELVIRDGHTYWAPVTTSTNINSFAKWEQAFRVFANIFSKANPTRSSELIEYNHIIHTIALAYTWDNVYTYDKEFRLHMSRNPHRSWSIILQQAWSMRLRDRLSNSWASQNNSGMNRGAMQKRSNELCRKFNRGRCNFGPNCKFDHRCSYCQKFGHGSVNCRKAIADHEKWGGNNNSNQQNRNSIPIKKENNFENNLAEKVANNLSNAK